MVDSVDSPDNSRGIHTGRVIGVDIDTAFQGIGTASSFDVSSPPAIPIAGNFSDISDHVQTVGSPRETKGGWYVESAPLDSDQPTTVAPDSDQPTIAPLDSTRRTTTAPELEQPTSFAEPVLPDKGETEAIQEPEKVISFYSVPHLERYIRRSTEPRWVPDRERFEAALGALERAVAKFDDPELDGLDRAALVAKLLELDPDGEFPEAIGRYFATSLTMFRDLYPLGSDASLTFTDVLTAKLVKRYVKYGDVPRLIRDLDIVPEVAFQKAAEIYTQRGGRMTEEEAARAALVVAQDKSVEGLSTESAQFYRETGRPFSGVLSQIRGEIKEVRDALAKLGTGNVLTRLRQRGMSLRTGNTARLLSRFSITQIEALERNDPMFGTGGEAVDVFIANLDIAEAFGEEARTAIIRHIHEIRREDEMREKAPEPKPLAV